MPTVYSRCLALCATATVTTTLLFSYYRVPQEAYMQSTPKFMSFDSMNDLVPLWSCMRFLDERQTEWRLESSNFLKGEKGDAGHVSSEPKVQVLRLDSSYSVDTEEARPVPFMRVVGFFPNARPDEVLNFMTDLKLRKEWDKNYHMFCRWDGNVEGESLLLNGVQRPIELVAKRTPVCEGDHCLLLPDVTAQVIDNGWFAHRVGHTLLDKFGIANRLFVYHRHSVCYTKRGSDNKDLRMFDVLYSGSEEYIKTIMNRSEGFKSWVNSCVSARETIRVSMNYQHLIIIPIADAASQLWANPLRFSCSGSMIDENSTRSIYNAFNESAKLYQDTKKLEGALMIMTSANDAQIPRSVPMWAQRMLASFFSNHAYRELMKAINAHRYQIPAS